MVLTSSAGKLNLNQLMQLVDSIMEASPPSNIAATDMTNNSSLTAQVTDLSRHLKKPTNTLSSAINTFSHHSHSPSPPRQ